MESPSSLTPEQLIRYSRHLRLPGFDAVAQRKLLDARVLIVGLGGLGSPASLYLAAAGIGTLGLAEFDTVESHNLQRQILFGSQHVGKSKLSCARERLADLNPDCQLISHPEGIRVDNALDIFSGYDVIVDGSDNFPTRYLCNDAAWLARKPLVHGSIFQFEGQLAVFDRNRGGPCYRCLFPSMPEPGSVPNCDQAGVLGALPGMVGSLQALETIKLLVRPADALHGKLFSINTLNLRCRTISPLQDPDCPLCGTSATITELRKENYQMNCEPTSPEGDNPTLAEEITIIEALRLLQQEEDEPLLLDVREEFERDIVHLPNSTHIPLAELPARWSQLDVGRTLLIYCHHGMRSLHATRFLRERGLDKTASIRGGIDAWAIEADPTLARY